MLSLNYLISILQIVSCLSDFENINVKFDNYLRPDEPDLHMLDDSNYQGHEHYDDFGQHYSEYDHDLSLDEEKLKFDSADQDKTGYLNETEFVAFEHPHNYRHMAPYELKHTLRDFDKDKDGFINELEYLAD
ncbi:uncharacterized protein DC041_0011223, partial [Schistosoma bovis]